MARLGVVTIGQAPRDDLTPEIRPLLGNAELVEHGALDELSRSEIADLAPGPGEKALVSRLRDGSPARLLPGRVEPLVRDAVLRAETDGVAATLLACTGDFADFPHQRPLLSAEQLLVHGTRGLVTGLRMGVVAPDEAQVRISLDKWHPHVGEPLVEVASPYDDDPAAGVARAAALLAQRGAEVVVLDCISYTTGMRRAAMRATRLPIVLARTLTARLAAELADR